jgi:hypothetical protein
MIVVKIFGGLGNQLFQYALALKLAKNNNCKLILDLSWFNSKTSFATKRNFDLKYFNISLNYRTSLYERLKLTFYNNKFLKLFPFKKLKILSDKDEINFNEIDNVYLNGYWHSYNFFDDIKEALFCDLTLNANFNITSDFRNQILSTHNSVSVHVRRTDYVNNPFYAQCTLNYFQNAMALIGKKVENPVFFIFSDDIEYVKKNLITNHIVFFAINHHEEIATIEDFFNMQACKHHIISNSTFSWWSSLLNNDPKKIVIVPEKWYNNPSDDSKGYYLDSYLMVNNDF